jgi:hypothetical protein
MDRGSDGLKRVKPFLVGWLTEVLGQAIAPADATRFENEKRINQPTKNK